MSLTSRFPSSALFPAACSLLVRQVLLLLTVPRKDSSLEGDLPGHFDCNPTESDSGDNGGENYRALRNWAAGGVEL